LLDRSQLELLADCVIEKGRSYPVAAGLPQLALTALGGSPSQKYLIGAKVSLNGHEATILVARNCSWSALIVPANWLKKDGGQNSNRILEELRMRLPRGTRCEKILATFVRDQECIPMVSIGGKAHSVTLKRASHPTLIVGEDAVVVVATPRETLDETHQTVVDHLSCLQLSAED
jgi:hypothetical protein